MKEKEALYSFSNDNYEKGSSNVVKQADKTDIIVIPIDQIHDFKNHPYKVEKDVALLELMQSIEKVGVIVPALVRPNPYGEGYEMIAGHRRKEASLWAGRTNLPVVIRELTDDEAVLAMVDSNLQREHLKPSEKAFAYKMKLDAMRHQGLKRDEKMYCIGDSGANCDNALSQVGTKCGGRSDEMLARQVGESRNQIARYIRLTNLISDMLDMVDEGRIAFTVAVELSYLKEQEQEKLLTVMEMEQCTPSLSQANRIKRYSQEGKLTMEKMLDVLSHLKPNQREKLTIQAETLDQYFPDGYTPQQKVKLIQHLVKKWYEENNYKETDKQDKRRRHR